MANDVERPLDPRSAEVDPATKSRMAVVAFVLALVPALCMLGTLAQGVLSNADTVLYMGATGFFTVLFGPTGAHPLPCRKATRTTQPRPCGYL
jgi:hypothetical protein